MTEHTTTVIGVFEDRTQAAQAVEELRRSGFGDDRVGFAVRHDAAFTESQIEGETRSGPNVVVRGIVGGIMGAIDALLVPITGPADASSMLGTVLPVTEEAMDRLPYPGSKSEKAEHTRPDAPMIMPDNRVETLSTAEINEQSSTAIITTPQSPLAKEQISTASTPHTAEEHRTETNAREGLVAGGVVGGIVGAGAALLIPGIGPAIAGGILAATLGGAAIGGISGGFLGTFTHMGIPEEKARYYEQEFKAGRTIVTVKADDLQQKAEDILRRHGAHNIQAHT